ncbi:MAG TPA: putative glycoside hydrolase [Gemmatimonadaceae bacterium]|jgi:hypothetical protein|nr:putative glycoside hydrolase [Gemmatimonadaceae bacterium]
MLLKRTLTTLLAGAALTACGGERARSAADRASADSSARAGVRRAQAARADSIAVRDSIARAAAADTTPVAPSRPAPNRARPAPVEHQATPDPLRALYVSRASARGDAVWRLIQTARHTPVNALVFDVKDDDGHLLYPSTVGLAHLVGADTVGAISVRHLHAIMDSLRRYRIYAIARIVVARDPVLVAQRPQWALIRRADNPERNAWVDARHREVWAYAADLASEAVARGFSEVMFDDVRFPDSRNESERLEVTPTDGRSRSQVIRDQLGFLQSRVSVLDVPMSIGVEAMAALDSSDLGIGQRWEMVADHADAIMLSILPSRIPAGTAGLQYPQEQPVELVNRVLEAARRRSASLWHAARIVPLYQDPAARPTAGDRASLRAELEAGYGLGVKSWVLWNAEGRYTEGAFRSDSTRKATGRAGGRSRR